jgi:V8-like Glu-specific endopeptidase
VRSYWTKQRIRSAEPMPFTRSLSTASAPAPGEVQAAPTLMAPTQPLVSSGPIPYSRHQVSDPTSAPYRTTGLLTGITANGLYRFSCSGTVVTSQNRSVVWTAGHCVHNREFGGWSRSLEFIPGYSNGIAPYGEWPVTGGFVSTKWTQGESSAYDMAALVVAPNLLGQRIEDLVGGRGILTGVPPQQDFAAFGYPGTKPFDGESQWVCESPYGGADPYQAGTMAIGCDMTFGSSGGGWIVDDAYLNSVISYGYDDEPEVIYGPYFGATAATLQQKASTTLLSTLPGNPVFGDDSVEAAPAPSRITHAVSLSLRLHGNLVASGAMTAPDGYAACTRRAPVRIYVRTRSRWEVVGRTSTHDAGRFHVRIPDGTGTYKAFSPRGSVDDLNACAETTSSTRRHRS